MNLLCAIGRYYILLVITATGLNICVANTNLITKPMVHNDFSNRSNSGIQDKKIAMTKPFIDIKSINNLIKSVEQALINKDLNSAYSYLEKANKLSKKIIYNSSNNLEITSIRMHLVELQNKFKKQETISLRLDSGLKKKIEPNIANKDHNASQLEKCALNNIGAVFDFPIDLNDKVLGWVKQFTTKKRVFMEQALSRASRYLPMVHQIFAEERVPKDLAYLAAIESGFLNSASSCANAVGMWQFMHATGKSYGLNKTAWVEERRDPVKATRAAAKYLRQLYVISGDWYLALVGYNAGPKVAERAVSNLGTRNFWDMYRSRWLSNQTKNYVPELCAAILIGRFPEKYGLKVEQMAPYTYDIVEVKSMVNLAVLSKYSAIDLETFKSLNPELSSDYTPPNHYLLRVPPGTINIVANALEKIPIEQRQQFVSYKTNNKETLLQVASKFKININDLLSMNNITSDQFIPGQEIRILSSMINTSILSGLTNQNKNKTNVKLNQKIANYANIDNKKYKQQDNVLNSDIKKKKMLITKNNNIFHTVKRGESLFAIADYYKLNLIDLKTMNGIKNTEIYVGQHIRIKH